MEALGFSQDETQALFRVGRQAGEEEEEEGCRSLGALRCRAGLLLVWRLSG